MTFNSYTFFIFFTIVLALHYSPLNWQVKKINLLIASYIFYAAWHPPFVVLLLICTLVDWFAARGVEASEKKGKRSFFLIITLTVNLSMLAFFKYADFLLNNSVWLLNFFHIHYQPVAPDIILPLGISFFTFQSLTYTFNIYLRKAKPWPSFLDFALFVSFFPKLIAGPIVRHDELIDQFNLSPHRPEKWENLSRGLVLFLLGLTKKILII